MFIEIHRRLQCVPSEQQLSPLLWTANTNILVALVMSPLPPVSQHFAQLTDDINLLRDTYQPSKAEQIRSVAAMTEGTPTEQWRHLVVSRQSCVYWWDNLGPGLSLCPTGAELGVTPEPYQPRIWQTAAPWPHIQATTPICPMIATDYLPVSITPPPPPPSVSLAAPVSTLTTLIGILGIWSEWQRQLHWAIV